MCIVKRPKFVRQPRLPKDAYNKSLGDVLDQGIKDKVLKV